MRPQDIIRKKRDRQQLSREEIAFFVDAVTHEQMADYQISALLMAVYLNGLNHDEQQALTEAMLHSGTILDFSDLPKPKVDKHSTGGVGDKASLLIAPMVAACGACVPMISGRGLGHTGGTLDKLESIAGYRVNLSVKEFRRVLERVGFAMIGQTADIAPADKKMYALRDATSTVESIPLIVASIISKKGAAGLNALAIDVKVGSGAFMRNGARAMELAHALVETGNSCGIRTRALLTDMNQPLGRAVGNALEVEECLDILRGEIEAGSQPVLDLSIELAAQMLVLADVEGSPDGARARLQRALDSGAALESFRRNVEAQGGDPRVCDDPAGRLPLAHESLKVESPRSGFITAIETTEIGLAIAASGGGRVRIEDRIDPAVGYITDLKIGDRIAAGEQLGLVKCRELGRGREAALRIQAAYQVGDEPPEIPKLIKEVIDK